MFSDLGKVRVMYSKLELSLLEVTIVYVRGGGVASYKIGTLPKCVRVSRAILLCSCVYWECTPTRNPLRGRVSGVFNRDRVSRAVHVG